MSQQPSSIPNGEAGSFEFFQAMLPADHLASIRRLQIRTIANQIRAVAELKRQMQEIGNSIELGADFGTW